MNRTRRVVLVALVLALLAPVSAQSARVEITIRERNGPVVPRLRFDLYPADPALWSAWHAEGRRADLILLDANPLDNVANAARRVGVMLRGFWYPEAALRSKQEAVAAAYAKMEEKPDGDR